MINTTQRNWFLQDGEKINFTTGSPARQAIRKYFQENPQWEPFRKWYMMSFID